MWKKYLNITPVIGSVALSLLLFQNCGGFESLSANRELSSSLPDGGLSEELPGDGETEIYDANGCPLDFGPGQNINPQNDLIYGLDRIKVNFGLAASSSYTCRADMPEPYRLDPVARPYEDRAGYNAFMGNYWDFAFRLSTITDDYLRREPNQSAIAVCAQDWIFSWASSNFLNEDAGSYISRQGDYERLWAIAGFAMSYARIRNDPGLDPAKKAMIDQWLLSSARKVNEFTTLRLEQDTDPTNNILYWSGLSILTTGLMLDQQDLVDRGIELYDIGLNEIQADGLLPLELARGENAFAYHNFATRPLVFMAEVAAPFGINLYDRQNGKIKLLTARVIQGFSDFSSFPDNQLQGTSSNPTYFLTDNSRQLDWMEAYYSRFPSPELKTILTSARLTSDGKIKSSRQTGGNATIAYGVKCLN